MKILLVSSYLPYPLFSGGHVRLYNLLKLLSKNHQVTLICEKREYQTEDDINKVNEICNRVITVPRIKQWSLKNIFKTAFSFYPFLLVGHSNNVLRKEIDKLLSLEKFDLIHIETFYVMQNLPKTNLPVVLVEHNIEYKVYERFLNTVTIWTRPLLLFDILKLKYWEKVFWKRADKVIAVSKEEKDQMNLKNAEVVANGVNLEDFKFQDSILKFGKKEKRILFIGNFKWVQNRDAVEWILRDIWSKINVEFRMQNSELNLKLWVVGRNIPEYIKKMATDKNVILDENAPDKTSDIFEKADLLLAPIRVGGGTSFKILESMASGVPVVTTALGIEGIEAKDNEEVLIADDVSSIVNKTIEVLTNKDLYEKLTKNARKLIEEKYNWERIVQKLDNVYRLVIDQNHQN